MCCSAHPSPALMTDRRQEVRQTYSEAAARHPGICCQLCRLQGAEEGLHRRNAGRMEQAPTDAILAHQKVEHYPDHTFPGSSCLRGFGPREVLASQQGHLLLPARTRARKGEHVLSAEGSRGGMNLFCTKSAMANHGKLKLRLRTLLDKKRSLQGSTTPATKLSSSYVTLNEGFRLFSSDLDKLQQFIEVNQTAFSKILKKVRSSSPPPTLRSLADI